LLCCLFLRFSRFPLTLILSPIYIVLRGASGDRREPLSPDRQKGADSMKKKAKKEDKTAPKKAK
jgi:hypothetical protein